jgi:hypothetical protein
MQRGVLHRPWTTNQRFDGVSAKSSRSAGRVRSKIDMHPTCDVRLCAGGLAAAVKEEWSAESLAVVQTPGQARHAERQRSDSGSLTTLAVADVFPAATLRIRFSPAGVGRHEGLGTGSGGGALECHRKEHGRRRELEPLQVLSEANCIFRRNSIRKSSVRQRRKNVAMRYYNDHSRSSSSVRDDLGIVYPARYVDPRDLCRPPSPSQSMLPVRSPSYLPPSRYRNEAIQPS